jgi:multicomponent Na+:H+ antiporter subunit D
LSILLPLALCWLSAIAFCLLDGTRRSVGLLALFVLLATLGVDVLLALDAASGQVLEDVTGRWSAGVGIRLHVDALSALFALCATLVLVAVLTHELVAGVKARVFPSLILFLAAGLHGLFFTGDAFNFYVFFELSMVSAFALAAYGHDPAALRATWVFVMANLVGSVLLLVSITSLYDLTGTLDLVHMAERADLLEGTQLLVPGALLFAALALKLGLFPFHAWLPPVYRDTRPAVAAAFAGALSLVGSYGLLRLGLGVFRTELVAAGPLLTGLGAASVLYGTLLGLHRYRPAEAVAYAAIAHAGYLMIAVGIGGPTGVIAALWLTVAGALDKSALFLSLETPGSAGRFAHIVAAMSSVGIPLTAGFLGKLYLVRAVALDEQWVALVAVIAAGAMSIPLLFRAYDLLSGPSRDALPHRWRAAISVGLAAVLLFIGVVPAPLTSLMHAAAAALGAPP